MKQKNYFEIGKKKDLKLKKKISNRKKICNNVLTEIKINQTKC